MKDSRSDFIDSVFLSIRSMALDNRLNNAVARNIAPTVESSINESIGFVSVTKQTSTVIVRAITGEMLTGRIVQGTGK